MTEPFENREINNQIADRDSQARVPSFRLKNAEGKILQRKMGIGWHFDERFEWHNGRAIDLNRPLCVYAERAVHVNRPYLTGILERANPRGAHRSCNCRTRPRIFVDIAAVRY